MPTGSHDSGWGMRTSTEQTMAQFMRHHNSQQNCQVNRGLFLESCPPVAEYVGLEANAILRQIGDSEGNPFRMNRMAYQPQMQACGEHAFRATCPLLVGHGSEPAAQPLQVYPRPCKHSGSHLFSLRDKGGRNLRVV